MKQVIIVTGASSGMGVEFAVQLAKESVQFPEYKADEIWLVARRKEKLEETRERIHREVPDGPKVILFPIDISGAKGARELAEYFTDNITIKVLVNNAGFGTYGEFANTSVERQMEMTDLNCTSLIGITGYALPYMYSNSRIINTASLASFMPLGNFAVYGATKAYVLSFTAALRSELKDRGIKVTALCPGPVSTEFANVASKGARKEVRHGKDPVKTVAHAIKASRKGKLYPMFAFKWKFKAFMSNLIDRRLGAWFTYKFCKRPSN